MQASLLKFLEEVINFFIRGNIIGWPDETGNWGAVNRLVK
jgi:hypothetical protein